MYADKYTTLKLIDKYLSGKANRSEQVLVEEYYDRMSRADECPHILSVEIEKEIKESIHQNILKDIHNPTILKPISHWRRSFIKFCAAILIATVAISVYIYLPIRDHKELAIQTLVGQDDIGPGRNRALLTLADGREIDLDDANIGQVAETPGVKIIKTNDGQIVYELSDNEQLADANLASLNTISTPTAGQYQVILPDGTKVWLNSESSISYPSRFSKKERYVEIKGEAYFEVAPAKQIPFIVKSAYQKIEVLGTHFNINAYSDEERTETTLIEGSLRIHTDDAKKVILKPNQQSVLRKNSELTVLNVLAEDVMAWKNGRFVFNDTEFQQVMRIVSRWYDVDVEYRNGVPEKRIGGDISRFEYISQLLEVLEATGGIRFKREGRRVIVM